MILLNTAGRLWSVTLYCKVKASQQKNVAASRQSAAIVAQFSKQCGALPSRRYVKS